MAETHDIDLAAHQNELHEDQLAKDLQDRLEDQRAQLQAFVDWLDAKVTNDCTVEIEDGKAYIQSATAVLCIDKGKLDTASRGYHSEAWELLWAIYQKESSPTE